MASRGIRKASMLLMSLDPSTAAELLKSAGPELIKQIATEMAYLQSTGVQAAADTASPVEEFCQLLRGGEGAGGSGFVRRLLADTLGEAESQQILSEVEELAQARDPFLPIRSAGEEALASALAGESPQAVAVVLAELPPKKSARLVPLLSEEVRADAVFALTSARSVSPGARLRVASVVRERLRAPREGAATPELDEQARQRKLRSVAVMLRGLEPELRQALMKTIEERDAESAEGIQGLMVIWDDVAAIADRSLQAALHGIDARALALALFDAEEAVAEKTRANISERAAAMLDEELSLLKSPKAEDVETARGEILKALREQNDAGELSFE